jgi:type III secretion system FlhB-like substrate exporter
VEITKIDFILVNKKHTKAISTYYKKGIVKAPIFVYLNDKFRKNDEICLNKIYRIPIIEDDDLVKRLLTHEIYDEEEIEQSFYKEFAKIYTYLANKEKTLVQKTNKSLIKQMKEKNKINLIDLVNKNFMT